MSLDVRLPIGLLFVLIGALLAAHGLTADRASLNIAVLGLNIDLVWGVAMVVFGLVMLGFVALNRGRED